MCRPENCGAALLLERLRQSGFTGKVELHFSNGIVGAIHTTEIHTRERLLQLSGEWPNKPAAWDDNQNPAPGALA
jgi:hypothetical protein